VYLVERAPRPGGTVACALIHTLAGLYDSRGQLLQGGLAAELVDRLTRCDPTVRRRRMGRVWVLSVCPNVYRTVTGQWIAEEPNITLVTGSRVQRVHSAGGLVDHVDIAGRHGPFSLRCQAVVDATGTAEVVGLLDPGLVQAEVGPSAAGLIFRLRGMEPGALDFPRGAAVVRALHDAAGNGSLPESCGKAWIDSGLQPDEAFVKLFVPLPDDWTLRARRLEITRHACRIQAMVTAFLAKRPAFAQTRVVQTGRLGIRGGARVRGQYCLTGDDVRRMRKVDDPACRACWPIEYWDAEHGVSVEYLPEDDYYEIPLRALRVDGLRNLWAAGKCLSADRHALASARVAGTCWAMGEAAGKRAALADQQDVPTP
jgi:hypothetical protein